MADVNKEIEEVKAKIKKNPETEKLKERYEIIPGIPTKAIEEEIEKESRREEKKEERDRKSVV
jgi:hypothetical protein